MRQSTHGPLEQAVRTGVDSSSCFSGWLVRWGVAACVQCSCQIICVQSFTSW